MGFNRIFAVLAAAACIFHSHAVTIFGSVNNNLGTSVCGLILANGQSMFSCSPAGSYSLDVPLDNSGQISLYGFAEGHFPYKATVAGTGGRYDISMTVVGNSCSVSNSARDKSAQLVGGTWTYTYTIISTFNDSFTFTSVSNSPDTRGNYFVSGTSSFGRAVGGAYDTVLGQWAVLYPGIIIDQFYVFSFSGNNSVSGCYYQISPPGTTNLSRCYSMVGSRFPPKSLMFSSNPEQLLLEVAADGPHGPPDAIIVDQYLGLRSATRPAE